MKLFPCYYIFENSKELHLIKVIDPNRWCFILYVRNGRVLGNINLGVMPYKGGIDNLSIDYWLTKTNSYKRIPYKKIIKNYASYFLL